MVHGFDISHHNRETGFSAARFALAKTSGQRFVIIKATEGASYVDPAFGRNWRNAKAAGLTVGAYHFARPEGRDAALEAQHFVRTVRTTVGGWRAGNILPVLDLETDDHKLTVTQLSTWVATFIAEIRRLTTRRTMVYTYTSFLPQIARLTPGSSPLWIARYTTAASPGPVPPWDEWAAWQYTSTGRVPGIGSKVDRNRAPSLEPLLCRRGGKYKRVAFRGRTVDKYTRACLLTVERKLGYQLTLTQGSYNRSVDASAGTHAGGGVVDIRSWDHDGPHRKVRRLRETGMVAWYRTPTEGPWPEHIHAVQRGNARLSPAAKRQIEAWRRGENGLADRGPDTGPNINVPIYPW